VRKYGTVASSDGPFGDVPLRREKSSALEKGRRCGGRGESGAEGSTDEVGSKDSEIGAMLASWTADDLLRTGGNVGTGAGVGMVDKTPLVSASVTMYGVI
jgi:hypothetical protein